MYFFFNVNFLQCRKSSKKCRCGSRQSRNFPKRCPLPGLNQRPYDLQSDALPTELRRQAKNMIFLFIVEKNEKKLDRILAGNGQNGIPKWHPGASESRELWGWKIKWSIFCAHFKYLVFLFFWFFFKNFFFSTFKKKTNSFISQRWSEMSGFATDQNMQHMFGGFLEIYLIFEMNFLLKNLHVNIHFSF